MMSKFADLVLHGVSLVNKELDSLAIQSACNL